MWMTCSQNIWLLWFIYKSKGFSVQNQCKIRFVTKFAKQGCHNDLHYFILLGEEGYSQKYLIAFVEDSKFLYTEILDNKNA